MKQTIFILLAFYCFTLRGQDTLRSAYERKIDSLYQINIKIAQDYGRTLQTNPNAIRPEPAIWFLDMNGNMYDYPPDAENDSIMRERALYQKKLDSLNGKQFRDLEKWHKEYLKKKKSAQHK